MSQPKPHFACVAVAQLDFLPAALVGGRSPLEDPLFAPGRADSLVPPGGPGRAREAIRALRARLRAAYVEQLRRRLRRIVDECRGWGVQLLVLPEYSVPWELLPELVRDTADLVIVAGTHAVDQNAIRSGVYEKLGARAPQLGQAVCPILGAGGILGMQAKLQPSRYEDQLRPGTAWAPLKLPPPICTDLGVLVCRDFLQQASAVADALHDARFLAVPSLTTMDTAQEFDTKAWEQARRYGRPVLYTDAAAGGGTTIFVDEGSVPELRDFPRRVGLLEPGDEGVIAARVDLEYTRPGRSTRYDHVEHVEPIAAASLVYRALAVPERYAAWLDGLGGALASDQPSAVLSLADAITGVETLLLDAGAVKGAVARDRRLQALLDRAAGGLTEVEQIRRFLREVVVPDDVLPMWAVRGALARAAAEALEDLGRPFRECADALREAARPVISPVAEEWTDAGLRAIGALVDRARAPLEPSAVPAPSVREMVPRAFDLAAVRMLTAPGLTLRFGRTLVDCHPRDEARARVSPIADRLVDDVKLLATAWGAGEAAVARAEDGDGVAADYVVADFEGHRVAYVIGTRATPFDERVLEAMAERVAGLSRAPVLLDRDEMDALGAALRPRLDGTIERVAAFRTRKLGHVRGVFVPLDVLVDGERREVGGVLDAWFREGGRVCLVLGEFGRGKSTVLADWAVRRWTEAWPRPLLVDLAGESVAADPLRMLLDAAGVPDEAAARAAMRVLVRRGDVVPCFDGFDEMATRVVSTDLPGRLRALVEAAEGGRVLISSRDNYFRREDELTAAIDGASGGGALRLDFQPLSEEQIARLVRGVRPEDADAALNRIVHTYPLRELADRPLLLGMVLETLDAIAPDARITRVEIYERYLQRWLEQTRGGDRELFSDAEKERFAEVMAAALWKSAEARCDYGVLEEWVRREMRLPEDAPAGAAWLEIEGGAFFVREGERHYRFAHKSFLEFFLARRLLGALPDGVNEALDTRRLTPEVVAFVAGLLRREGAAPERHQAIEGVRRWLVVERKVQGEPARTARAAANAVRLLVGLQHEIGEAVAVPEGAWLREIELRHEDLAGAVLRAVDLGRARLAGAKLERADLTGASIDFAELSAANLDGADLTDANLEGTRLVQAFGTGTCFRRACLADADLSQSVWVRCDWSETRTEGSRWTAAIAERSPVAPPRGVSTLRARHRYAVHSIAWAPDGGSLALGAVDGTLSVWDVGSGEVLARFDTETWDVRGAWAADGARLASGGGDGIVRVWDVRSGETLARFEDSTGQVQCLAWSPDATRLAFGSDNGTICVWQPHRPEAPKRADFEGASIQCLAWAPDGVRLAVGTNDGTVRVWDVVSREVISVLVTDDAWVESVAWASNGTRLAAGTENGAVLVWDTASYTLVARSEGRGGFVRALAWAPNDSRLASGDDDGLTGVWNADSGRVLVDIEGAGSAIRTVAWDSDGRRIAVGDDDGVVRICDAASGELLARYEGDRTQLRTVAWPRHGLCVATVTGDGTVRVWSSGSVVASVHRSAPDRSIRCFAWNPGGGRLATGGADHVVRVSDVESGEVLARFEGHEAVVRIVAWSPDGARLASVDALRNVVVWDVRAGRALVTIKGNSGRVRCLAWAPDERLLAVGDDRSVLIWDVDSVEVVARLEGPMMRWASVAWAPDGSRLASCSDDGAVRVWDVGPGSPVASFRRQRGSARSVAWAPDGHRLGVGTSDGSVHVLDARTLELRFSVRASGRSIWSIAWAPDGRHIASASLDGCVLLWDTVTRELAARLEVVDDSCLATTPSGFFDGVGSIEPRLEIDIVGNGSDGRVTLLLPGKPLRPYLCRPKKVAAALAGDLSGDDVTAAYLEAGLRAPAQFDGHPVVFPSDVPKLDAYTPLYELLPGPFQPGAPLPTDRPPPGRETLTTAIAARLAAGGSARLLGPRRGGKTQLLRYLEQALKAHHTVYALSLQDARCATPDALAASLAPGLADHAHPAAAFRDRLAADRAPVILIDEVGCLRDADLGVTPNVFGWLRGLGQEHARCVYAGTHGDWDQVTAHDAKRPGSSFGNDLKPFDLRPLDRADAIRFLLETAPNEVSDQAAAWITDLCNGWPFYLQVMGEALVDAVRAGRNAARVDRDALCALYDEALIRGFRHIFETRSFQHSGIRSLEFT